MTHHLMKAERGTFMKRTPIIFCCMLCICLFFSSLLFVHAEEPTERSTSLDLTQNIVCDGITYDPSTSNIRSINEGWYWNSSRKTLTLSGTVIHTNDYAGILLPDGATVRFTDSAVSITGAEYGIYGSNLTLSGNVSADIAGRSAALCADGSLLISNLTLTLSGSDGCALYAQEEVTITGCNLKASGKTALNMKGNCTISETTLSVVGYESAIKAVSLLCQKSCLFLHGTNAAIATQQGIRLLDCDIDATGTVQCESETISLTGGSFSGNSAPVIRLQSDIPGMGKRGCVLTDPSTELPAKAFRYCRTDNSAFLNRTVITSLPTVQAYRGVAYHSAFSSDTANAHYAALTTYPTDRKLAAAIDAYEWQTMLRRIADLYPDYLFSIPAGLSLNTESGEISGVPSTAGKYVYLALAYTDNTANASSLSIVTCEVIAPEGIIPKDFSLPTATLGEDYRFTLTDKSAFPTIVTYQGELPKGLTLTDNTLSGKPLQNGHFPLQLTFATNDGSVSQTIETVLHVANSDAFATTTLPDAKLLSPYEAALKMNDTRSYRYALAFGKLPEGVTLDENTGLISGTPSEIGDFPITVSARATGQSPVYCGYVLHVSHTDEEESPYLLDFRLVGAAAEQDVPATLILRTTSKNDFGFGAVRYRITVVSSPDNADFSISYQTERSVRNWIADGVFPYDASVSIEAETNQNYSFTARFETSGTYTFVISLIDITNDAVIQSEQFTFDIPKQAVSPTAIILESDVFSLQIGRTTLLEVQTVPAGAISPDVTWTSSDPDIVSVSNYGVITGVSIGTATITATTKDHLTASCIVTVIEAADDIDETTETTDVSTDDDITTSNSEESSKDSESSGESTESAPIDTETAPVSSEEPLPDEKHDAVGGLARILLIGACVLTGILLLCILLLVILRHRNNRRYRMQNMQQNQTNPDD